MRATAFESGLRRTVTVAAVAAAAALLSATTASGINSYNATPAPERTEVGALVVTWDDDGDTATPDNVDWVCSGTMIDAGTFLTAAHCTTGWPVGARFFVSLEQDVQAGLDRGAEQHQSDPVAVAHSVGVEGSSHSAPGYPGTSADSHDIAVDRKSVV